MYSQASTPGLFQAALLADLSVSERAAVDGELQMRAEGPLHLHACLRDRQHVAILQVDEADLGVELRQRLLQRLGLQLALQGAEIGEIAVIGGRTRRRRRGGG